MPNETRAEIKKASLKDRSIVAICVSVVAALIGALALLSPLHRLGWIIWMAGAFYAVAYLAGVDSFVNYLSGRCPHCSRQIRAEVAQKKIVCKHCQKPIAIVLAGTEKRFIADR